ncbi:hypothetical protein [Herbaspirillum chlorophenolicum]|uniref:hypothetical protein n=1 Tax=Herbaspirillum chlorophenolicum TaxID=211589 RepID=UPI0012E1B866|nr:hypothetical protein [Herbaspirillum chlorophenolicum]
MLLNIEYRLTGIGWASCKLVSENSSCLISASYLSDALYKLISSAISVCTGVNRISFGFDEEPGEFRWIIKQSRINEIEIEIRSFEELWGGKPDEDGEVLFQTQCRPITFAKLVYATAQLILEDIGESGYLEKWHEHPFPSTEFRELKRLINKLPD